MVNQCSNPECTDEAAVKYCSRSCAATVNNRKYPKRGDGTNYDRPCANCEEPIESYISSRKYCSLECSAEGRVSHKVERWKRGEWDGSTKKGQLSATIRNHLLKSADNKCPKCGWSKDNPVLGYTVLTIDHIDGDWTNNSYGNLEVMCYNCHTLTETFGVLNHSNPNRKSRDYYNHRS